MAETTQKLVEREYVIPLRREWMKVPRYKRTAKGVKAIKEFIARHMRVPDRDVKKVKLDMYLNNELWRRGGKKPPAKITVKAVKKDDIVTVELVRVPEIVQYLQKRQERYHAKPEKKAPKASEEKKDETAADAQSAEEKKEESEKEKAVAEEHAKHAAQAAKTQKHTVGKGKAPQVQRKALKK